MKVDICFDIQEFEIPELVREKIRTVSENAFNPFRPQVTPCPAPSRKFRLSELDSITLDKLCKNFTSSVFHKAGVKRPPEPKSPEPAPPLAEQLGITLPMDEILRSLRVRNTYFSNYVSPPVAVANLIDFGLVEKFSDGDSDGTGAAYRLTAAGEYIAERIFD